MDGKIVVRTCGLVLCAAALLCVFTAGTAGAEEPIDPVKLLPEEAKDASFVGSIDVREIAEIGALDSAAKAVSLGLEQLKMQIGRLISFDLKKDVSGAAFAVTPPNGRRFQFVALVAGSFDSEQVYQVIAEKVDEAKAETYANYKLFSVVNGEEKLLFGILDDRVALVGTEEWAQMVIDNYKAGSQGAPAVLDRLKDLGGSIRVSVSKALLPDELWTLPPLMAMNIGRENVKSIGFSVAFSKVQTIGMDFQASVGFDNPESAKAVQQTLEFFMGSAKATQPMSRMLLDDLSLDAQGDVVTLKANAPASMSVATTAMLAGMLMPSLSKAREQAKTAKCKSNLRQIGIGLVQYLASVGGHRFYPPDLKALMDKEIITEPGVFVCPLDPVEAEGWYCSYESIFDLTDEKLTDDLPADTLMVWDNAPRHGGRCVSYADGHVEYMTELNFQAQLAKLKEFLEKMK